MKILLIFRLLVRLLILLLTSFHYIWFIDSENLCFIFILKEKMTRFRHLILFTSLALKLAPPCNKRRISQFENLISTAGTY